MIEVIRDRLVDAGEDRGLPCIYINNHKGKGPRGDYYDWFAVLPDGKLIWGDEQGNYAGGTVIYPSMESYLSHDTSRMITYDVLIQQELENAKIESPDFYEKVVEIQNKVKSGEIKL